MTTDLLSLFCGKRRLANCGTIILTCISLSSYKSSSEGISSRQLDHGERLQNTYITHKKHTAAARLSIGAHEVLLGHCPDTVHPRSASRHGDTVAILGRFEYHVDQMTGTRYLRCATHDTFFMHDWSRNESCRPF